MVDTRRIVIAILVLIFGSALVAETIRALANDESSARQSTQLVAVIVRSDHLNDHQNNPRFIRDAEVVAAVSGMIDDELSVFVGDRAIEFIVYSLYEFESSGFTGPAILVHVNDSMPTSFRENQLLASVNCPLNIVTAGGRILEPGTLDTAIFGSPFIYSNEGIYCGASSTIMSNIFTAIIVSFEHLIQRDYFERQID